jgi:hypothetical protein
MIDRERSFADRPRSTQRAGQRHCSPRDEGTADHDEPRECETTPVGPHHPPAGRSTSSSGSFPGRRAPCSSGDPVGIADRPADLLPRAGAAQALRCEGPAQDQALSPPAVGRRGGGPFALPRPPIELRRDGRARKVRLSSRQAAGGDARRRDQSTRAAEQAIRSSEQRQEVSLAGQRLLICEFSSRARSQFRRGAVQCLGCCATFRRERLTNETTVQPLSIPRR